MKRLAPAALVLLAISGLHAAPPRAAAAEAPVPPCNSRTVPGFPAAGAPPAVRVWSGGDVGGWQPQPCTGWEPARINVLVAAAGRFREPGGGEAILARFAAVSAFLEVRYWFDERAEWRPLIRTAYALNGANRGGRRPDFAVADLDPGGSRFLFLAGRSALSGIVYRMEVRERTADRLVVTIENVSPLEFLFIPVFGPRGFQLLLVFERDADDLWRSYTLLRVSGSLLPMFRTPRGYYVSRATAVFRYFAGMPTDQSLPAQSESVGAP